MTLLAIDSFQALAVSGKGCNKMLIISLKLNSFKNVAKDLYCLIICECENAVSQDTARRNRALRTLLLEI